MFSPWLRQLLEGCPRATGADVCRRRLRMAPANLVESLPMLGSVMYMPLAACGSGLPQRPCKVLVETPPLALLLRVHWLLAVSEVAVDGPREWIDGIDRDGRPCMRLHLLPDTDYLGWDRLLARGEPALATLHVPHLHALEAYPLRFRRHQLAGFDVLRGETAICLSPLGRQLAARIARAHAGQGDRQFR
ncbi:hypothetical protein DEO45_13805 [Rhodanobacter denitrificans]|uniref:Uncharacterized protein n=1 Tax=Rhodanobacter denitrificans TaxID=666685 RepID=A0A368KB13_9GAMM|nr:hypothetical protein [Rhodanobacter denitrificans]RCS29132.1 hypothetical protein DEO45_13805 [Rhodanobacter denitrificans]